MRDRAKGDKEAERSRSDEETESHTNEQADKQAEERVGSERTSRCVLACVCVKESRASQRERDGMEMWLRACAGASLT
eukprot:3718511-Pleurochrysis_carterae.AAC.1